MTASASRTRPALTPRGLVEAVGVVLCAATVAGFLARLGWLFELTTHFRPHLAAGLFLLTLIALGQGRVRLATLWGCFAALNLLVMAPRLRLGDEVMPDVGVRVKLVAINVHSQSDRTERVLGYLQSIPADVILVMEVNDRWLTALAPLQEKYPHRLAEPREDDFGIALFSRLPLASAEVVHSGDDELPSVAVTVEAEGGRFFLLGTHPLPPGSPGSARARNAQFRQIAALVRAQTVPVVVLGDLNTTPWSPFFADLLRESGLRASLPGRGLRGSWPAWLPVGKILLDHCLVSPGVAVREHRLGPRVSGDHLPVMIELQVQPSSKAHMNPANTSNMPTATNASATLK